MRKPLQKGECVVMHTCGEAEHYDGRIWACESDEFTDRAGQQVVFLEGFSGYFLAEFLQRVDVQGMLGVALKRAAGLEDELEAYKEREGAAE
ncbi:MULTISPECIES: hypothetical protein [Bacillus subtilis group]|uniref:hypothetical protein n=1 Tax=Bacillus subtilis group TaxID=653685 RepID=UPI001F613576|nr:MULTISPECIES: hypothetical protein [Bacillus subtilis group]MCI4170060.1 hypothetical protein [Bacillus spizizenii]WEY89751.1 hypothetical protein P5628_06415 [Bacillus subtilis]WEZ21300.1 hypothetical protein P5661_06900 [Bacillus subtilis]